MVNHKTILVTGATSGIGRATALYLARRGHRVLATGRREERLESLVGEADGAKVETFVLDVTDPASIENAVRETDSRTGGTGIDVLINNAGYVEAGPMEELSDADLRCQFDTNFFAVMAMIRAFLPKMRERGAGRIVITSSVAGRFSPPLQGAYNATKHAVEAAADALRNEVAQFGVQVVLIEPGLIQTEIIGVFKGKVESRTREKSSYSRAMKYALDNTDRVARMAPQPIVVAQAMAKAVESGRPKARYVVPARANVGLFLAAHLPTRFQDWITRRFMKLDGRG